MRDPVAEHNRRMWDRLARAGHPFTTAEGRLPRSRTGIRRFLDPYGRIKGMRLSGARVLALAAGGGWDGIAFAKLGADTTVLDLSPRQVETVRRLARLERVTLKAVEGEMKDLSRFPVAHFHLVWHCHSLVFVDDCGPVFHEVARVLAPGGTYLTGTMHPTTLRLYRTFDGRGWVPLTSYLDPGPVPLNDDSAATWEWEGGKVVAHTLEYGHTFETLVNGIAETGMMIDGLWEYNEQDPPSEPEPGSDEHLESLFPSYIQLRARKPL
ncbi:MAG: class I SAM-dependent methyltransferase [Actinomycetota bacterium]